MGTCSNCEYLSPAKCKCLHHGGVTSPLSVACNDKKIKQIEPQPQTLICPRCKGVMNMIWDELGGYDCSKCNYQYDRGRY